MLRKLAAVLIAASVLSSPLIAQGYAATKQAPAASTSTPVAKTVRHKERAVKKHHGKRQFAKRHHGTKHFVKRHRADKAKVAAHRKHHRKHVRHTRTSKPVAATSAGVVAKPNSKTAPSKTN
jgi:hypothetical protein